MPDYYWYVDKPEKPHGGGDYKKAPPGGHEEPGGSWAFAEPPLFDDSVIGLGYGVPTRDRTGVWINIHADPERSPDNYIDNLDAMVDKAGRMGHKLTILLTAQWIEGILTNSAYQDMVAVWLSRGHRIGSTTTT